jgi:hypothetical protein
VAPPVEARRQTRDDRHDILHQLGAALTGQERLAPSSLAPQERGAIAIGAIAIGAIALATAGQRVPRLHHEHAPPWGREPLLERGALLGEARRGQTRPDAARRGQTRPDAIAVTCATTCELPAAA